MPNRVEHEKYFITTGPGFAIHPRTETSLCQPSSKWVPFPNQGKIRQRKESGGLCFHKLCPRYSRSLTPTVSMAIRLWEAITFLLRLTTYIIDFTCTTCIK